MNNMRNKQNNFTLPANTPPIDTFSFHIGTNEVYDESDEKKEERIQQILRNRIHNSSTTEKSLVSKFPPSSHTAKQSSSFDFPLPSSARQYNTFVFPDASSTHSHDSYKFDDNGHKKHAFRPKLEQKETEISDQHSKTCALEDKIKEKDDEIKAMKEKVSTQSQIICELNTAMAEKDATIQAQDTLINQMNAKYAALQQKCDEILSNVTNLGEKRCQAIDIVNIDIIVDQAIDIINIDRIVDQAIDRVNIHKILDRAIDSHTNTEGPIPEKDVQSRKETLQSQGISKRNAMLLLATACIVAITYDVCCVKNGAIFRLAKDFIEKSRNALTSLYI